jgi:hypothetical protein
MIRHSRFENQFSKFIGQENLFICADGDSKRLMLFLIEFFDQTNCFAPWVVIHMADGEPTEGFPYIANHSRRGDPLWSP